jgi:hypothetical protein
MSKRYPDEKFLVKPENTNAAIWNYFRCELIPDAGPNKAMAKYQETIWCLLCRKEGTVGYATYKVRL